MEEVQLIIQGPLKREIQTIETKRMIVGYVYFQSETLGRTLCVHNLFVKKSFRRKGLAKEFLIRSFDLNLFDSRVSINIMNEPLMKFITERFAVKPVKEFLDYEIRYPSFVYSKIIQNVDK